MSWIIGNRKLGLAGGRDVPVQIGVENPLRTINLQMRWE
jgi:hypothetical protein